MWVEIAAPQHDDEDIMKRVSRLGLIPQQSQASAVHQWPELPVEGVEVHPLVPYHPRLKLSAPSSHFGPVLERLVGDGVQKVHRVEGTIRHARAASATRITLKTIRDGADIGVSHATGARQNCHLGSFTVSNPKGTLSQEPKRSDRSTFRFETMNSRIEKRVRVKNDVGRIGQSLLDAVIANPEADEPRVVYADYLQERGDVRGEFIALQLQLHRLAPLDAGRAALEIRVQALLKKHQSKWTQAFKGDLRVMDIEGRRYASTVPTKWNFERGFIQSARLGAASFHELSAILFSTEPISRIHFTGGSAQGLRSILNAPGIEILRELDLGNWRFGAEAEALFASEKFARVEVLDLNNCQLGVKGMTALRAAHPLAWPRLHTVNLTLNALKDKAMTQLAQAPLLSGITRLRSVSNEFGPEGFAALMRSPHMQRLEDLHISGGHIGAAGCAALVESSAASTLQTLSLRACSIGTEGVQILSGAAFPRLKKLTLAYAGLDARAVPLLHKAKWLHRLQLLDVSNEAVAVRECAALAPWPASCRIITSHESHQQD
jgi:uncharacterized protein (TIGR02996 family)